MRAIFLTAAILAAACLTLLFFNWGTQTAGHVDGSEQAGFHDPFYKSLRAEGTLKSAKQQPNDWFVMQRAYPGESIPTEKYYAAVKEVKTMRAQAAKSAKSLDVTWEEAGPTNIPGRLTDLAIDPTNPSTIYIASAAGGVFKSTDAAGSWTPIFDDAGVQSIGAIALDPGDPQTIYVGTGEANSAGDTYEGNGVWKSTDGGANWTHMGLEQSYHIGRIVVDTATGLVWTAVAGKLFGTNPERGVYRSADGGANWDQVFFIDDSTACIDIAIDTDDHTVYAAMWHRWRFPTERRVGGYTSGIWRSSDDGDNWEQLTLGLPAAGPDVGRIGLAVESTTNTVYAIYADHPGYFMGVYKSTDGGTLWAQVTDFQLEDIYSSFGWYFGNIRVAPGNPNLVFALGVDMMRSTNGGNSWEYADGGTHVDHHAFQFLPGNTSQAYDGCDGGLNFTSNTGDGWTQLYELHNTQFYAITIDKQQPERLYGGAQDNGTMRTLTGALDDWDHILGGDGFYCLVDYTDNSIIYAEYQNGYLLKSTNTGGSFSYVMDGIDYDGDRHNWSTPIAMDPADHRRLYYGSNRLYQSTDGGDFWTPITGDLTDGPGPGNLTYGTITTIDVSPLSSSHIYVGTDDGNVWHGNLLGSWQNVSVGLPNRWVTRVVADPHRLGVAYVTLSGYKMSEQTAHIYRSDNHGIGWTPISGNMPDMPVNDLIVDDLDSATLYIATDGGVFYTQDLGVNWEPLGSNLPVVPVHDLDFHPTTRKLVAGTHGRSMYKTTVPIDFTCGDANHDGLVNVSDAVRIVGYIFSGQPAPSPYSAGDCNCDGVVNITDAVYLIAYIFAGGPGPCDTDGDTIPDC